ncbi:hypothetical protein FRC05_002256 [Tulasnella sp. 425]|nr:hypothetical protein FRC05_002256 [Tulasnella sp. 425]
MRRARKQAQREQARAAAARDHQEEADGEDNGSPVAGPSTSPASSSRATKRKIRRATEPALHRIPSLDDATGGPNMPEEYGGRMAQASRQQQQLEISRRVSMDDYALQQAAGMMDRRGSGGSDEDTQGDDLADQPGPSSTQRILGASVTMPSGPMGGSTEQPLGLHGAHTTSPPALVSSGGQLPPMSMDSQGQSMQFWQQPPPSSVAAQHQAPISPTTVVAPHVSHLPGPGPAVPPGMPLHASSSGHHPRQPSWPPSGAYGAGSSSQVGQQSGGPPPLVPATSYSSHHSNPLPFPLQPSAQQTQSPPSHMQQQTHIQHAIGVPTPSPPRSAPQTQTQHFQAHSQQQYSASPPPAAAAAAAANSMHRLHQSSMLLTPLNVGGGASHRQSYAQEPSGTQSNQPSAYGQTTIGGGGGPGGSSAQGLPSVFELESLSRDPAQEQQQRGSIQQQQQQHAQQGAPIVQQTQTTSWESYQQSSTYSAAGPSHRDSYAPAAPPSLGRSVGGYDPSREYYPPTSRPDMYGGQRNVVYGAAVPQSRPEAHPAAAYGHPQRSVSYSAPASSDPYMVPGPSQSQRTDAQPPPSSYIPARSESYGGARSDPYGAQQQQRPAPEQQQYQTIPPPQSHIPHHPSLHPQHLPSSDPAHPDPRHDPYGRGHPGPSEGPY